MAAVKWSRYEFANVEQDDDGNLFLDVPEPITREQFPDDSRLLVTEGTTPWTIAWTQYRAMLDPEQDVRPSGFWWVGAELNNVVDAVAPLEQGKTFRVPGIETLVSEILPPPPFFSRNRET